MVKGHTLIEVFITSLILGIIILGVAAFLRSGIKFFHITSARIELQRSARTNLQIMMKKLREATANSIVIDRLDDNQPPCSKIYFTTADGEQISYFQKGTTLYRCDLIEGTTRWMADDLRHITFTYPMTTEDKMISISLCFEKYSSSIKSKIMLMSVEKVRIMN